MAGSHMSHDEVCEQRIGPFEEHVPDIMTVLRQAR